MEFPFNLLRTAMLTWCSILIGATPVSAQPTYRSVNINRSTGMLAPDSSNLFKLHITQGTNILFVTNANGVIEINVSNVVSGGDSGSSFSNLYVGSSNLVVPILKLDAPNENRTNIFEAWSNGIPVVVIRSNGYSGFKTNMPYTPLAVHGASYFNGVVTNAGNIYPVADSTFNFGAPSFRWGNVYSRQLSATEDFATGYNPLLGVHQRWGGTDDYILVNMFADDFDNTSISGTILHILLDEGTGIRRWIHAENFTDAKSFIVDSTGTITISGTNIMNGFRMNAHSPGIGKVLTSDANGYGTWATSFGQSDVVVTNPLFHTGPTNGSITGKILTAGTGVQLTTQNNTQLVASATSTLLDGAAHTDTLSSTVTRGDIIVGNSTPKWAELAIGDFPSYLTRDYAGDVKWRNPRKYVFVEAELMGVGTTSSGDPFFPTTAGATLTTGASAEAGHPGLITISTAASSTATGVLRTDDTAVLFGGGINACGFIIKTPDALSDGTQTYELYIGFGDSVNTDFVDGAYLTYDHDTSANWIRTTANNSTRTRNASSSVVAANTWYFIVIVVNADATSVEYFVNGTSIGTETTNIPTGAGRECGCYAQINKDAGTTARILTYDYAFYYAELTNDRY